MQLAAVIVNKRALASILAAVIFSMILIGCSSTSEVRTIETSGAKKTEIPSDAEIISSIAGDRDANTLYDEDIQELKHWKYGVRPDSTGSYDDKVISFQLVSEEDMDRIIDRLTKDGYLAGQPEDEYQFSQALRDFQHAQGLPVTGELDSATLRALLRDQNL